MTLRPAHHDDYPFLRDLYASTRMEDLDRTGLDAAQKEAFIDMQFAAQDEDYRRRFPDAEYSLVLSAGQRVGRLYVAGSPEEVRILDITILPGHRNAGTGTGLIEQLLDEACASKRPVRIYLDNGSPSIRLFERLGFCCVKEEPLISLFEWRPPL